MSQIKLSNEVVGGAIGAAVVGLTMFTGLLNATNTAGAIIGVGAGWVVGAAVASYLAVRSENKRKAKEAADEQARLQAERDDPYRAVLLWTTERVAAGDFSKEAPEVRALLSTIADAEQTCKQHNGSLDDLKRIVRMDLHKVLHNYITIPDRDRDIKDSEGLSPRDRFRASLDHLRVTIKHFHLQAHEGAAMALRASELNAQLTRQSHVGIDGQRVDLDD